MIFEAPETSLEEEIIKKRENSLQFDNEIIL